MSIEYWTTNNTAGSGALWSTGLMEAGTNRNGRYFSESLLRDAVTVPVPNNIGADGINRPYIPLMVSEPVIGGTDLNRMNDYRVSQFFYDWTMIRKPQSILGFPVDDTNLKDLLEFVDDFCGKHMLATKEEIKEYEDAAINNKVHSIIKRLLK